MVAHHRPKAIACIPEEVLGIVRELLEGERKGESSSCPSPIVLQAREGARCCHSSVTLPRSSDWRAPLPSTLWQKQQIYTLQQEGDVEIKDRRPYLHCLDSRESVILKANTPMTLPEKKKRRGRDQSQLLQCLPQADYLVNMML